MNGSTAEGNVVTISNKVFHVIQVMGIFPKAMQPCCIGILVLEPTPFIQLVPTGKVGGFCEQYVHELESRGESDAQIARFRRHVRDMAQVVHWCAPDTLLVPEELCKPIGMIIYAKRINVDSIRLMGGCTKEDDEM